MAETGDQWGRPDSEATRESRRQLQQRRLRRQRIGAGLALLGVLAAIGVAMLASGGGGGGSHPATAASHPAHPSSKPDPGSEDAGEVRNATPQPNWRPYRGPVPILEYHELGQAPPGTTYPELFVGRTAFAKQMDWLEAQGFEAVTLTEVENAWFDRGTLPAKPVVISFDDGYRPQFTFALPELRRHGWPGVLNLKAEGSDLYQSNVEAMIAAGWELAAHTIHHSDLTTLESAALTEEVAGSREMLEAEFGVRVRNFCYPSGRFDSTVVAAVEAAGYVGATTEIPGFATSSHPFELARIEVLGDFGVQGLAEALREGAASA